MDEKRLSSLEHIKANSHYLRGTLVESLADPVTAAISADDTQVLKFHGTYQQDDRDVRDERRHQKLEPAYQFMIRTRLPGGVCTPAQWLALDDLARRYGAQSLRLTTRQTFQLHGVLKGNLKHAISGMHAALLDSIGACGDVNRNVICAVNPAESQLHATVYRHAKTLSEQLRPQTRAYHEIWLDQEKVAGSADAEPLYGPAYLPRKFKFAIAVPPVNDVDVFAHDVGLIAIVEDGALAGFNVTVGGGMGMTYGESETYPRLGDTIGFVTPDRIVEVAKTIVSLQRDYGNRENRKRARFKYTIDEHGLGWCKTELHQRLGYALAEPRGYRFEHNGDRFGWSEAGDGRWHLTLHIEAGRIIDKPGRAWLTGLREIARIHHGEFRLTPNQNLIIAGVAASERTRIDALVAKHGLDGYRRASAIRRDALSCVALPTCGLAMAEAERYLPELLVELEKRLDQHGLLQTPILLRISGCPNGCSRPYLGEIALTGKAPGRYNLYLGADFTGQRLNRLYRENIGAADIPSILDPLFARYAEARGEGERFGDFLLRSGALETTVSMTGASA